ncbi:MAG: spinster family MFS transporter [Sphingomonadales bacterium]
MAEARDDEWRASAGYSNYVLFVLFLGYVTNSLDRGILNILLPPIRKEFALNYTELGLLGGIAFALFYATLGIPIASLADRTSRKWVLAVCMALWSGATALCGLAGNFLQLLAARVGTSIGEAGGSPPSHSMIADYFALERRGTALSLYALGVSAGAVIAGPLGGIGNDLWGWRMAFVVAGAPGLFVALLVVLTVREPPRGMADGVAITVAPKGNPFAAIPDLWRRPAFRNMGLAAALHALVWYGAGNFNSVFLAETHHLSTSSIGTLVAGFALVAAAGTLVGGFLSDRLSVRRKDERYYMWVPGAAALLGIPFQLIGYLAPTTPLAVVGFALSAFFASFFFGPSFAMAQGLAPPSRRAVAASVLLFIQTMIGLGLGPLITGMIGDALEPSLGSQALRIALVLVGMINIWSALHYWLASRTVREDIARARREA